MSVESALQEIRQLLSQLPPISAQALLDLLLTVDGPGSGLNADLLDGLTPQQVSYQNPELIFMDEGSGTIRTIRFKPTIGTHNYSQVKFFDQISVSNNAQIIVYKGDGTTSNPINIQATLGKILIAGNQVFHEGLSPQHIKGTNSGIITGLADITSTEFYPIGQSSSVRAVYVTALGVLQDSIEDSASGSAHRKNNGTGATILSVTNTDVGPAVNLNVGFLSNLYPYLKIDQSGQTMRVVYTMRYIYQ